MTTCSEHQRNLAIQVLYETTGLTWSECAAMQDEQEHLEEEYRKSKQREMFKKYY